jgi:hypothetical protein
VPIPALFCIAFAIGAAAALAARAELRTSPRSPLLSRGFAACAVFLALVVVPISVYFYVFHGDWSLLYLVDVSQVPSAVALVGFVVEWLVGLAGFLAGAALVRSQRDLLAGGLAALGLAFAGAVAGLARDRLAVVGSYAQFRGGFGLVAIGEGPLLPGAVVMSTLLVGGVAFLLVRLQLGSRRG